MRISDWSSDVCSSDLNGTNGSSFAQAEALCTNMKAEGVIVYTVGFANASTGDAAEFVEDCATSPLHVYLPTDGTELKQAFRDIDVQVTNLRIFMGENGSALGRERAGQSV